MRPWSRCFLWAAALLLGGAVAQAQQCQEPDPGLEVGYDYSSRYIFRGLDLLDRQPTPTPLVTFTKGGLSVYYEGHFGEIGVNGPDYEEHDFGVDYTLSAGRMDLTFGGTLYTYRKPRGSSDEIEVYAIAGLEVPLQPKLSVYYNPEAEGTYASLEVSRCPPLAGDRLELKLSSSLGFDLGYYSKTYETGRSSGLSDLLLGADLSWQVADPLTLHLGVFHSFALEVLDAIGQEDETFYTVGTAVSF